MEIAMSKITVLVVAGVSYVLGAKAGTERYEAIKAQANRLWKDPRVQDTASQAQQLVVENAPKVQAKIENAATAAASKAQKAAHKKDSTAESATDAAQGSLGTVHE
jgi:hypothetical protein